MNRSGLWLPENMRPEGTGTYAHGVEVASDFAGEIPSDFDVIDLLGLPIHSLSRRTHDDEDYQTR